MKRNIALIQLLVALSNTWFWLGIWVFFYLRFTNYAGIGLLEATQMSTSFILEIPTGAVADILGRKRAIIAAFALKAAGSFIMATAGSFSALLISLLISGLGGALLSGTTDALLYDSLQELHEESKFDNYLARIQKYSLVIMAAASLIGGFLYTINSSIPFIATAAASAIAFVLSWFLTETHRSAEKSSFRLYAHQSLQGFRELLRSSNTIPLLLGIVFATSAAMFFIDTLDPALAINWGFNPSALGILFAILPLVSAAGAHFYPQLSKRLGSSGLLVLITVSIGVTAVIAPLAGVIIGTTALVYRNAIYPITDVIASTTVNKLVESKYRATTLSTFFTLSKLPYVLFALPLGILIDHSSARLASFCVGGLLLAAFVALKILPKVRRAASNPIVGSP